MQKEEIEKYAKELVIITIKKHKENLLGKEKMSVFLKNNLNEKFSGEDYDNILHLYSSYLAKEGYEIKKDINHFDIIDYNSDEYQTYCNNLTKKDK